MVQFQEKKDELDMLVRQRRQEQYLKDGTNDIKQVWKLLGYNFAGNIVIRLYLCSLQIKKKERL